MRSSDLSCPQVRRSILDFTRRSAGANHKFKITAQMSKQNVRDLLDVCCVFVYVKDQVLRQVGTAAMEKIMDLWLKGLRGLDCAGVRGRMI
jgi:hypothetical protein